MSPRMSIRKGGDGRPARERFVSLQQGEWTTLPGTGRTPRQVEAQRRAESQGCFLSVLTGVWGRFLQQTHCGDHSRELAFS